MNKYSSTVVAADRVPRQERFLSSAATDRDLQAGARKASVLAMPDPRQAMPREVAEEPVTASSERILVIEDDHGVQKALRRLFEGEGFTVDIASNGTAGLEMFRAATPSIVVLDLRLPGMPGQDVCREVSQAAPSLPIIILSARTDVMDKVLLLELGAHDYVTKPFSPRELLARVRTAMRRSARGAVSETFSFGDVRIDVAKMEVRREGRPVQLTSQEFKVLKFMIQNAERVLSREELLNSVWGYQNYPSTRTVDNHILRLRQKLEKDPANPVHFRTLHSAGYKFVP
jgi:DNA-binding response OmpR family regulator